MGMARASVIIIGFTCLLFSSSVFGMEEYRAKRDAYLADHGLLQNYDQSNELQFTMHYGLATGFRESNSSTAKLGVMLSAVNFSFSGVPLLPLFEQSNFNIYLVLFIASGGILGLGKSAHYAYKSWNYSREVKEMDEIKKYLVYKG
jgi:hypothetical protein